MYNRQGTAADNEILYNTCQSIEGSYTNTGVLMNRIFL